MFQLKKESHTNSKLESILIENEIENFSMRIYPNLGASLQEFSKNNHQIIDGISNDESGLEAYKGRYTSAFLFPFPNRIANGAYEFSGKSYQLETNETALNNALHGFIANKSFDLIQEEVTETAVILKFEYNYSGAITGYPFPFKIHITYTISLNNTNISIDAVNTGSSEMPFGIGWHPYFKVNNLSESTMNFDAFSQYEVDAHMIPTKETSLTNKFPLTIGETALDDCFLATSAKASLKTKEYDLSIDFKSNQTGTNFIQCYTPPTRDCIAIEPMTCAPNVFNNNNGLLGLKPNESYNWHINMSV